MQPHNFFSTDATPGTPTRRHALGRLPTPPPLPENLLLRLHRKLPSEPPASTQEVSEPEVPVHVPLRRPRPFRFERLRVSVESIQPRPPRPCEVGRPKERRRKNRRQSHKFFKHRRSGWHPNSPATPWGGSPLRPLCQKICYSDCTENCPLSPLRAPRRFRNPRFPFTSTPSPPASLPIRKAPSASVESIEPRPPRPCEVGRPKGRRRKNRCNLTIFLAPTQRLAPQLAAT